jgi:type II secretory pathway pseudopilin PulG
MLKATHLKNNKGFSLLEASVVMIVAALIVSTLAPSAILNVVNQAAQKTTLDVNNIESASLAYYAKNNSWPTSIAPANGLITDLETSGFLPSGWNASNPFGKQYTISTTASLLTVSTQVQSGTQTTIISQLILRECYFK